MALGLLRFVAEDLDPRRVAVALPQALTIHRHVKPAAAAYIGPGTAGGVGPLVPRDCGLLSLPASDDPLVVLDPLDPLLTSNVARSCFRFSQVRTFCRQLHARLSCLTPDVVRASAGAMGEALEATSAVPRARAEPPRKVTRLMQRFPVLAETLAIRPGPPAGDSPAEVAATAGTPRG